MKTKLIFLNLAIVFVGLTSLTLKSHSVKKSNGGYQIGYFVKNGQEYDAYADLSTSGPVTDLYKTDNNGDDLTRISTFSGTHTGHTINITFTDGTQMSYQGTCYF